jgi:two-component system NarL family response regulator
MQPRRIRVLCVEDHGLVLEGIVWMIGREPDLEVVGTATTGEQAIECYQRQQPDVTLMDLQLPGISGLDAIRAIRAGNPKARIIVLTMYQGDENIHRALQAGATTYLLKDALSQELIRVVREVHGGGRPIPPNIAALLEMRATRPRLTDREVEIVKMLARGLRNKEIADALILSEETVRVHVKHILKKLNVNDRTAAVTEALTRGIIQLR